MSNAIIRYAGVCFLFAVLLGCNQGETAPIPTSLEVDRLGDGSGNNSTDDELRILIGDALLGTMKPGQTKGSFPLTKEQATILSQAKEKTEESDTVKKTVGEASRRLTLEVKTQNGWDSRPVRFRQGLYQVEKTLHCQIMVDGLGGIAHLRVDNRRNPEAKITYGRHEWLVPANGTENNSFRIPRIPTDLCLNGKKLGLLEANENYLIDVSGERIYEKQEKFYAIAGLTGTKRPKGRIFPRVICTALVG